MINITSVVEKTQKETVTEVVSHCKNCPYFDDRNQAGFRHPEDKRDNGWCELFNNSTRASWQINDDCINSFDLNDLTPHKYEKGDLVCYIDENKPYTQWQQGNIFDYQYEGRKGWKYYTETVTGSFKEVTEHEICLVDEAEAINTEGEF